MTPWGLLTRANLVRRGRVELDAETADAWAHCTGCGRCVQMCKHRNDVPGALFAARAEAIAVGLGSLPLQAWASASEPESARFEALPSGGQVVMLPGYADAEHIEAALYLLSQAGLGRVGRPWRAVFCSGARLREAGQTEMFEVQIRRAARAVQDADQIICLDPLDAVALKTLVPRGDRLRGRVQHLVEALDERRDALAERLAQAPIAITGDVLYLDACHLGRGLGVHQAPRQLLASVISGQIVETLMSREEGGCCGAGAGFAETHPDIARQLARAAAEIPLPLVTASPICAAHLRGAIEGQTVHDWAVLLANSLRAIPAGSKGARA